MDKEIEYLKKINPNSPIQLEALKALKQLSAIMEQPIDAPEPFKSILQDWHQFRLLAIATVENGDYPALSKCWHDIQNKFAKIFDDETFLDSWCFLDFPCLGGQSYAYHFYNECLQGRGVPPLKNFINKLRKTRLGLYQVILVGKKIIKVKELFTEKVLDAYNTVGVFEPGEILLVRLVEVKGKFMIFTDPKCFPKEHLGALTDMVVDKAYLYYTDKVEDTADDLQILLYEKHMKLSGPYWISVTCPDTSCKILSPDYYKNYTA